MKLAKDTLHSNLKFISQNAGGFQVIDGVNYDDLQDHRPGIAAAKEAGVISPLAELKIGKESIRNISKALGFPWWNKPAEPCLASRFPYGEVITVKVQQVLKNGIKVSPGNEDKIQITIKINNYSL